MSRAAGSLATRAAGSLAIVALAVVGLSSATGAARSPAVATQITNALDRSLLDTYCAGCHNSRQRAGGLAIDTADLARVGADAGMWERVGRQLRAGTMPPAGSPRPDRARSDAFVAALEAGIDAAAAASPRPGRPVIHRLNRVEYANAVRDLLALEIDAPALLPADESLAGFDNIGGVLSMSPSLLERYLSAAGKISRLAVGDRTIGPAFASTTYQAPQTVFQDARMSEDLPFGSRGGLAVRHHFPLDAEYALTVRLLRNILGYVRGLTDAHRLEVRLDGVRHAQFTVGGKPQLAPAPLSFTGVIAGDPGWEAYALTADEGLTVRFRATAGEHVVAVTFLDELLEPEGVLQPELTGLGLAYSEFSSAPSGPWGPAVEAVSIDGPYAATGSGETPSRRRLFSCRPGARDEEDACARQIISTLARRGYRGPVAEPDLDRLMTFYRAGRAGPGSFERGIQAVVERLLVDPRFLFRIERDPPGSAPGSVYRVNDVELASRLSFFLWSSIPDEPLLDAAERDMLHEPATLDAQVRRMIADDRSRALVENFAVQWLGLRQLRPVTLDAEIFTEYDGNLREAFLAETQLFVRDQMRQDRSVLDLLTARYTFVNERLARHYGIPGVYGSHFRRVVVGDDRAGLLGHGSVLTATSYPTRTSPVLRGRWLLDTLLGTPPPPPPPDIPALPSSGASGRPLTVRQRTEQHRANPACAGCHVRMDPLGFALESFDALGRRRTADEAGGPIDASGAFPDGTTFTGVSGLRALVAGRPEELVRTLTGKLMTYALGRAVEDGDLPAIRAVVREAGRDDYRWSALIRAIVRSVPFQMRQAET
jgi:hypothetical protein